MDSGFRRNDGLVGLGSQVANLRYRRESKNPSGSQRRDIDLSCSAGASPPSDKAFSRNDS